MGSRGPVPKRNAQVAGHKAKSDRARVVAAEYIVKPPRLPKLATGRYQSQAVAWYHSLGQSGQSRFYEPSDWQHAIVVTMLLSHQLSTKRPSAEALRALFAEMDKLGSTENARRRMRIEVARPAPDSEGEGASVTVLERFARLGAS